MLIVFISACSRQNPLEPASRCGPLSQEAEAGQLFGAFEKIADLPDGNASAGFYISTPDDTAVSLNEVSGLSLTEKPTTTLIKMS